MVKMFMASRLESCVVGRFISDIEANPSYASCSSLLNAVENGAPNVGKPFFRGISNDSTPNLYLMTKSLIEFDFLAYDEWPLIVRE